MLYSRISVIRLSLSATPFYPSNHRDSKKKYATNLPLVKLISGWEDASLGHVENGFCKMIIVKAQMNILKRWLIVIEEPVAVEHQKNKKSELWI